MSRDINISNSSQFDNTDSSSLISLNQGCDMCLIKLSHPDSVLINAQLKKVTKSTWRKSLSFRLAHISNKLRNARDKRIYQVKRLKQTIILNERVGLNISLNSQVYCSLGPAEQDLTHHQGITNRLIKTKLDICPLIWFLFLSFKLLLIKLHAFTDLHNPENHLC